jgi:HPt (histidine-containing phosphotransfer) domain-containing protein
MLRIFTCPRLLSVSPSGIQRPFIFSSHERAALATKLSAPSASATKLSALAKLAEDEVRRSLRPKLHESGASARFK